MSSLDRMSSRFKENDMNFPLSDIMKDDLFLEHMYDMGTPTRSQWTVVANGNASFSGKLKVVGQNKEIKFPCIGEKNTCPNLATQIRSSYMNPLTWCDECFEKKVKEEDKEDYLPVVNSPRIGDCGYTG